VGFRAGSSEVVIVVDIPSSGRELAEAFAPFDRARLAHSDQASRVAQLAARESVYEHVAQLWADVARAGEHPSTGEKYEAIGSLLELVKILRGTAFEAVYGSDGESA